MRSSAHRGRWETGPCRSSLSQKKSQFLIPHNLVPIYIYPGKKMEPQTVRVQPAHEALLNSVVAAHIMNQETKANIAFAAGLLAAIDPIVARCPAPDGDGEVDRIARGMIETYIRKFSGRRPEDVIREACLDGVHVLLCLRGVVDQPLLGELVGAILQFAAAWVEPETTFVPADDGPESIPDAERPRKLFAHDIDTDKFREAVRNNPGAYAAFVDPNRNPVIGDATLTFTQTRRLHEAINIVTDASPIFTVFAAGLSVRLAMYQQMAPWAGGHGNLSDRIVHPPNVLISPCDLVARAIRRQYRILVFTEPRYYLKRPVHMENDPVLISIQIERAAKEQLNVVRNTQYIQHALRALQPAFGHAGASAPRVVNDIADNYDPFALPPVDQLFETLERDFGDDARPL